MSETRISSRSEGAFNSKEWLDEGDGLLAAARTTRATWAWKHRYFHQYFRQASRKGAARAWSELEGLPRASMLLLGYSIEMFLKAGLARAYRGCREAMFERDVRKLFGHQLYELAEEIDFPEADTAKADFCTLRDHILAGARYPVMPRPGKPYVDAVNQRTHALWNQPTFRRFCGLAASVRRHAMRIDADHKNPAIFKSLTIDADGYLMFRIGGHLRTRITYRPSSVQLADGRTAPDDIRRLLDPRSQAVLLYYWDQAFIVEDARTGKRVVRQVGE